MTMSGDQLRASRIVALNSDALPIEVIESVNGLGERVEGLSEQVSGLSRQFTDVHGAMARLGAHVTQSNQEAGERDRATHAEIALLRTQLVGDIAPRVTAVEKTAGAKAKTITIWGLSVTGLLGVAVQLASAFYPKVQGPLQTLLQLLNGIQ